MAKKKTLGRYRSSFEKRLHKGPLNKTQYEPFEVEYVQTRKYKPDFVLGNLWFEAKGFFRPGDQAKYMAVRDAHPEIIFVFIFSHPYKSVRRGAKMTMAHWANLKGFHWFGEADSKGIQDFIKENLKNE